MQYLHRHIAVGHAAFRYAHVVIILPRAMRAPAAQQKKKRREKEAEKKRGVDDKLSSSARERCERLLHK
jgi:hypothetical protein